MQPKHHLILYTFLSVALVLASFVALTNGVRAQRATHLLEQTYAQRVLEAQEQLQAMRLKLSKAQVATEARMRVDLLAGVSRQADGVVSALAALPLSHAAMSDTMKFCNQISEYTLGLALQTAGGDPLSAPDAQRLIELCNQCSLLLGQFATARDTMVRESLRLSAEPGVFYQEAQLDQRPLEQVADADNGMDYPTMIYDGAFSDARHNGTPKALGNQRVTQEQAIARAVAFVGESRVRSAEPAAPTGGPLASFGVTLTLTDGTILNADVTEQGGALLWMMPEHAQFTPALSPQECLAAARRELSARGFGTLTAEHYQLYDGLAVINLVPQQDGVLLYPDLLKAQLRMDTGELVGLEANNYLMNHVERPSATLTPTLAPRDALARVPASLAAHTARLCLIPYRDTERLCYEIPLEHNAQSYRLYLDAHTGEEVELLLLINTPNGELSAGGIAPCTPSRGHYPLHPSRGHHPLHPSRGHHPLHPSRGHCPLHPTLYPRRVAAQTAVTRRVSRLA